MTDDERRKFMYAMASIMCGSISGLGIRMDDLERRKSEMFIKRIEHRLEMLTEEDIENMI